MARRSALRQSGLLPKGGIARFYGSAALHKTGAIRDEIWARVIQPEKDRDPERKGFGVLVQVERAEDLEGHPLDLKI